MIPPLDRLHDSEVTTVTYDVKHAERTLTMAIIGHPDMGYAKWEGKRLVVRCDDVLLLRWTAWGHAIGPELLDAWNALPVDDVTEVKPFFKMGGRRPAQAWRVSFHSGSHFDVLCERTTVVVVGNS